jgi:hypothetical protein
MENMVTDSALALSAPSLRACARVILCPALTIEFDRFFLGAM